MRKLKSSIFILLFFCNFCFFTTATPRLYRSIITTGLNSDDDPINSLTMINFPKKIYIYNYWTDLEPEQEYECRVKFYDGSGQMVSDDSMTFSSDGVSHYTWFYYRPLPNIDKIGKWKMEVFLDGKRMITRYLTVKPLTYWGNISRVSWQVVTGVFGTIVFVAALAIGIFFLKKRKVPKLTAKTPPILPIN